MGIKDIFKVTPDTDDETEEGYQLKSSKDLSDLKNKTIIVEPRAFSEAQQIADYLKANNQVIVNFKRVTTDGSKRIMDFLHGIIYAIDGSMQKLGTGIVLCAPKTYEIEGSVSEDETKKGSKAQETDEW